MSIPLPPMSIFNRADNRADNLANLPSFDQYRMPGVLELAPRLDDAIDQSDAIAALKAIGLLKD